LLTELFSKVKAATISL